VVTVGFLVGGGVPALVGDTVTVGFLVGGGVFVGVGAVVVGLGVGAPDVG
jgi:hypothetical protein